MLGAHMPGTGTAHGETAQGDMIAAEAIVSDGMLHGLQDVYLAGELVGITEASVDVERHQTGRGRRLGLSHLGRHEGQLGKDVAPAM